MSKIDIFTRNGQSFVYLEGGQSIGQGSSQKSALHDAEQCLIDALAHVRQLLDEEEQVKKAVTT